ncbi:DUF7882 family protein [Microbacterium plantarum]|uniref:DUF7882 family protein n=1 Tax=Microbacterium plantarum TaxID=1816425 RepID=UPI002B479040|nr:ATP-dependent DNA ligase [Microbacterium plantarum]WRK17189.1 ATP-dependent DNA ligase [Microbacterium plantarum]
MGRLMYGGVEPFEVEERSLAHLRLVIMNKLRRNESFLLHLPHGGGVRSLWIDASMPLTLSFAGSRPATINRDWIEALMESANSSYGLQIVREPDNTVVRDPLQA